MPRRKKAIAYLRVSTEDQADNGAGLDLQFAAIQAFADAAGYDITDVFRDVHTGVGKDSIHDRPGVQAALAKARATGRTIIVDGLDRVSRHTATLEKLVASQRCKVVSTRAGEAPSSAVLLAAAVRAQEEAERISKKTREGLLRARQSGAVFGNQKNLAEAQRMGADRNRVRAMERAKALAPVVAEIRSTGKTSYAEIAAALNERGVRTPQGKRWNAATVRRPLAKVDEITREAEPDAADFYKNNSEWGIF